VQHCTPEQLALAALAEPLPAEDAAHLAGCERCRAEVASLARGVELLAVPEFAAPGPGTPPPPTVWSAIAAATGVAATPRAEAVAASAASAGAPAEPAPPAPAPEPAPAAVIPLRPRRSRVLLLTAAAAVAGAVVGAGAVALLDRDDEGVAVAEAELAPIEDADASGTAAVVERDGQRVLQLDLRAPDLDDGYYEVWLLDRDVQGMVPVGVVHTGRNDVELPDSLDLGEFPLVDVSVEPLDGDPTHSGVSVVRGELDT
jgi:hypothetical protein